MTTKATSKLSFANKFNERANSVGTAEKRDDTTKLLVKGAQRAIDRVKKKVKQREVE